ncbi:MAG: hypothetical protein KA503_14950, partial [Methyloversatilis sp.]|nr:hypothetical protein [Methyloversatilis sp.]
LHKVLSSFSYQSVDFSLMYRVRGQWMLARGMPFAAAGRRKIRVDATMQGVRRKLFRQVTVVCCRQSLGRSGFWRAANLRPSIGYLRVSTCEAVGPYLEKGRNRRFRVGGLCEFG